MALSLADISRISRAVVDAHFPDLHLETTISRDGDADRVELLLTVTGCHREPCQVMLNITRSSTTEFERDLRRELLATLSDHRSSQ